MSDDAWYTTKPLVVGAPLSKGRSQGIQGMGGGPGVGRGGRWVVMG